MRAKSHGQNRILISTPIPMDAAIVRPASGEAPQELILLLHGFAETGDRMLRKILPAIPESLRERAVIVAPNALFPMPHKTDSGYIMTFSWYFYDPGSSEYYIDMKPATEFLVAGLKAHGFSHLPKRIIGFSQGGFLAPIAAAALEDVRHFVGLGCEYLVDEIPDGAGSVRYRVDAIHGEQDESVSAARARESHSRLISAGVPGSFTALPGVGHRIEDKMREALSRVLETHRMDG
jgi:predicted esterase